MKHFKLEFENDFASTKKKVIFVWGVPAKGHLNPALCFINRLLLKLDEMKIDKIVFYSTQSYRDFILSLPNNKSNKIEFRDYNFEIYTGTENFLKLIMNFDTRPGRLFRVFQCWKNAFKLGNQFIFQQLIHDIHRDQPVLILYDQALLFSKLTFKLYSKQFKCAEPTHASYIITFLCARGVFPLWSDLFKYKMLGSDSILSIARNTVLTLYDFLTYAYVYYKTLVWEYRFSLKEIIQNCEIPFSTQMTLDDSLNLVFVLPELQPRVNAFSQSRTIKFVGPALDDSVRSKMNKYAPLIEEFLIRNRTKSSQEISFTTILENSDLVAYNFEKYFKPIIYVSLGTVFNNENSEIFETIAKACRYFSNNYAIIISTGDELAYEKYANSDLNNEKMLFVPHTPQIEILKRCKLFITHAGMNSVSEALQYGVPIICLPLSGDQPFVAWRVADELGIGIRLQADDDLTVSKVKDAIVEILENPVYRERANDLSLISKRYSGPETGVKHLIEFYNSNQI